MPRASVFIKIWVSAPAPYKKPTVRLLMFRETKDTVRVSLQEYLFTGSSKVTSCGFWQKRVRLSDLLEGGYNSTPGTYLNSTLGVLPTCCVVSSLSKVFIDVKTSQEMAVEKYIAEVWQMTQRLLAILKERKISPKRKFWPDIPASIRPKTSVRPSK